MAIIDDIAALLKSAGLDPRQSNGVLEAFRKVTDESGYTLFVQSPEFDPVDSTTYFFGALPFPPSTTGAERRVNIPRAGTITRVDLTSYAKTAGSNEGWSLYVRVNDTTQTLVATVSTSTNLRYFQASGLSIAVAAGDYIEIKLVCPAWGTNPVGVYFAGNVFVK